MKLLTVALFVAAALAQTSPGFEARHDHLHGSCSGRLTIDDGGVTFDGAGKKSHHWHWGYLDIQQLQILHNGEVRLLTYQDNKWRLGADREFHFRVGDKQFGPQMSPVLTSRLGPRFVLGLASALEKPVWELPVKHLLRVSGTEGTLVIGEDRIVYRAGRPGDSRTWLFSDIDHISRSGPEELTITTYERARSHYGNRKDFNFQLKQPLSEERYDQLWRRLEQSKGVQTPS